MLPGLETVTYAAMDIIPVCVVVLLISQLQLSECQWTFSLRINSTHCCDNPTCDQMEETCSGLFLALCLRYPGTTPLNRHNCPQFVAGSASTLLGNEITSENLTNAHWTSIGVPFIDSPYKGGVQVYFAMLTKQDLPPFGPDEVIVDEWFIELKRQAGGGECSPEDVVGAKGNVNVSLSVVVDCFIGYSGDDCNCSSGDTNCEPSGPLSDPCVPSTPQPTLTQPGMQSDEESTTLLIPVSAGVGGLVLLLVLLVALVGLCLFYRRRQDRKSLRLDLGNLTEESQPTNLPPTIPPSDIPFDGITYTAVVHNTEQSDGYRNLEYGEEFEKKEPDEPGEGLVYADLDHSTNTLPPTTKCIVIDHDPDPPTYTTFKKCSWREHRRPMPPVAIEESSQHDTIKKEEPHTYMNVPKPKPRRNISRGQQNIYSTMPNGVERTDNEQFTTF